MALRDIPVTTIEGRETTLAALDADVLLVVNVASRCGFARQYEGLEALHRRFEGQGFSVLGFPSNQFLQELGSDDAVAEYCSTTWGVTFPMFERVRLNGRNAHPLYTELTKTADADGKAGRVAWNFEKFLVLPGDAVRRFRTKVEPDDPAIVDAIEAGLGAAA